MEVLDTFKIVQRNIGEYEDFMDLGGFVEIYKGEWKEGLGKRWVSLEDLKQWLEQFNPKQTQTLALLDKLKED